MYSPVAPAVKRAVHLAVRIGSGDDGSASMVEMIIWRRGRLTVGETIYLADDTERRFPAQILAVYDEPIQIRREQQSGTGEVSEQARCDWDVIQQRRARARQQAEPAA